MSCCDAQLPSETDGAILKSVLPRRVGPALRAFIPESMYPATAAEWFAICAEQVSSSAAGDSRLVWCKLMVRGACGFAPCPVQALTCCPDTRECVGILRVGQC